MDSVQQVVLVLQVLLLFAPLAVYFMVLGLLNSQPTPRLINARSDFLVLTAAVSPLLLAPGASLLRHGHSWVLIPVLAVAGLAMWGLLPKRDSGWVVYNLSAPRARALLQRCLGELGWTYHVVGGVVQVPQRRLEIRLSSLPALRNVTFRLDFSDPAERAQTAALLYRKLDAALARQQLLPSLAGSCLMILGVGMMILPLWMMSRHSEAIAQVVTRLLLT
jgi:hypothetical protein